MRKFINTEKSGLFDVLAHIAYALEPLTQEERAGRAIAVISTIFNSNPPVFLSFVLAHYVYVGVEALDQTKLRPLLNLKDGSILDAMADLGKPDEIYQVLIGFQKDLYPLPAVA